jgi:hypothetical protein
MVLGGWRFGIHWPRSAIGRSPQVEKMNLGFDFNSRKINTIETMTVFRTPLGNVTRMISAQLSIVLMAFLLLLLRVGSKSRA